MLYLVYPGLAERHNTGDAETPVERAISTESASADLHFLRRYQKEKVDSKNSNAFHKKYKEQEEQIKARGNESLLAIKRTRDEFAEQQRRFYEGSGRNAHKYTSEEAKNHALKAAIKRSPKLYEDLEKTFGSALTDRMEQTDMNPKEKEVFKEELNNLRIPGAFKTNAEYGKALAQMYLKFDAMGLPPDLMLRPFVYFPGVVGHGGVVSQVDAWYKKGVEPLEALESRLSEKYD